MPYRFNQAYKSGAPHIIAGTYSFFFKAITKKKRERNKWKKQKNLFPLGVDQQRRRTAGMKRERATHHTALAMS